MKTVFNKLPIFVLIMGLLSSGGNSWADGVGTIQVPNAPNSDNSGGSHYYSTTTTVITDDPNYKPGNGSGGGNSNGGSGGGGGRYDSNYGAEANAKDGGGTGSKTKDGGGCGDNGTYGGASCDTTEAVNGGVTVINSLAQGAGSAMVGSKAATVQAGIAAQGMNATNADALKGQAATAKTAATVQFVASGVQLLGAAEQFNRGAKHTKSVATVNAQWKADNKQLDVQYRADMTTCDTYTSAEAISICKHDTTADYKKNVDANTAAGKAEANRQGSEAMKEKIVAGMTAAQAGMGIMQGVADENTAKYLNNQAQNQGNNPAQYFAPPPTNTGPNNMGTLNPNGTPDTGLVAPITANGDLPGAGSGFNPNLGNNNANGPAAGTFVPGSAAAPAGGPGGGLGGSGGTSASKDQGDGQKSADPAGKGQGGGQYQVGDAGMKFSRPGGGGAGGAGVGMDGGFADMMKNLLKGDDKKEGGPSLDINDRTPANDQAAVIPRDKNIFIEVGKRIQKKNGDGSVSFSDQG